MDVLALILACSLHPDFDLVRAIAQSNARSNPFTVIDAAADPAVIDPVTQPTTLVEAVTRLELVRARRHPALVGLLLARPEWADAYGQRTHALFDGCANISIGTAMLSHFAARCPKKLARQRSCVLRRYERAIGLPEFSDVVMLQLDYQAPVAGDVVAARAPVFLPVARRDSGTRIFFRSKAP